MCTGLRLRAADGSAVHGRTCEFGTDLGLDLLFVPAGTEYTSPLSTGDGLRFVSRFAVVGVSCFGVNTVLDGINDQGLSAGGFYFPGWAEYTPLDSADPASSVNSADFAHWVLSMCGTLDDVRQAVTSVTIADTAVAAWHGMVPPFHFAIYDRAGDCLVIESRGGKLVVTDNPIGVFTNSPQFEFHMLNLSQFTNVTLGGQSHSTVAGTSVTAFGMGTGGLGVPGDFSPPSRFVRAALFSANHPTPTTRLDAVHEVFYLLNNFDVPKGFVTEQVGGQTAMDWTLATVVRDPSSGTYYYRSYGDQTVRSVNLTVLADAGAPLSRTSLGPAVGDATPVVDETVALLAS